MASSRRIGLNENIRTYGGTGMGRDYTSLGTWEAATDNDLVTTTTSEVLEVYNDEVFDDRVTVQSAVTSTDYFRTIRPASGQIHDGTPNTGVRFSYTGGSGQVFFIREENFHLHDLSISASVSQAGNFAAVLFSTGSSGDGVGCLLHDITNSGTGVARGILVSGNTGDVHIVNCLAKNADENGFHFVSSGDAYFYNCTAIGNDFGFHHTGGLGTGVVKNCLASGNTTDDFDGSWGAASTTNASSDATAAGSSPRTSQTFTFVDAGSDDYHLAGSDTGALGFGTDLSGDATFAFDDDIDGETIATWSIGFDAIVASATGRDDRLLTLDVGR